MSRRRLAHPGQFDLFGDAIGLAPDVPSEISSLKPVAAAMQELHFNGFVYDEHEVAQPDSANWEQAISNLVGVLNKEERLDRADKLQLASFGGWGPLFAKMNRYTWALRNVLSEAQLSSARTAGLDSYFTPAIAVNAIWKSLTAAGFAGGAVLEPAAGSGRFLGLCPRSIRATSRFVAVEKDEFSAELLRRQFGDTETIIASGFEDARLPESYFDLVIGNVPFGTQTLQDRERGGPRACIHDFFILKSLKKLRVGGIAVLITSSGSMDKSNTSARHQMAAMAKLLGAVRLPTEVFANDGVAVVTDVLVFQRTSGQQHALPDWLQLTERDDGTSINTYFAQNPGQVLGTLSATRNRFGATALDCSGVVPNEEVLMKAFASMEISFRPTLAASPKEMLADATMAEGSYQMVDGTLHEVRNARLVPCAAMNGLREKRIVSLLCVRDSAKALLLAQNSDAADDEIERLRSRLNVNYDSHVAAFKAINDKMNRSAMDSDPSFPVLLSLEIYDEEADAFRKAPIFTRRTTWLKPVPSAAATVDDAATLSLAQKGQLDTAYMAQLLSSTSKVVEREMAESLGYFKNPATNLFEPADSYLSGNVRKKLAEAETAASFEEGYARNVDALQRVVPEDIPASDICVRLGQQWIPREIYEQWVQHEAGMQVKLHYAPGSATWRLGNCATSGASDKGTSRLTFIDLLLAGLNQQQPKVWDVQADKKRVLNDDATLAAQARLGEMQDAFAAWTFADVDRSEQLARIYNNLFNAIVPRKYDGSHLTFPGMSQIYTPRVSQRNGVWRVLQSAPTLLDHFVGAGKTLILAASAMELRRLGLSRKPLIVVANKTLPAFTAEFIRIYPSAKVLMMGRDDMEKSERRRFVAKVATGDWDAIIMAQSVFDRIGVSAETLGAYADEVEAAIWADSQSSGTSGQDARMLAQQAEQAKNRIKALHKETARDYHILFEDLGVDFMLIDEAHAYKNLFVQTKMTGVAGVATSASQRAINMLLKVRHVHAKHGAARGVVFSTATPLTNTMTEVFVLMKYLRPDLLEEFGFGHFDAWAAHFGKTVSEVEVAPDGSGFRLKERFAQFQNVPELAMLCSSFWDSVFPEQVTEIERPQMETGKPIVISVPPSAAQRSYISSLVDRADAVRQRRVTPDQDNMLKIVGDGAKAALDMRLIDPMEEDDTNSKLNACVRNVFEIWARGTDVRSTQIIFSDLGVYAKNGFCVYDDIRRKLIDRGIPACEIAFAQEHGTDRQIAELDRAVNAGRIRVLLGSTNVLGIGRNVQRRLIAWHHLDAPYRADEVEQRDGRGIRHGNTHAVVHNYRYVTEGSFDAYKWQTVERKARFTAQFRRNGATARVMEDLDGNVMSYAEVKALASGNAAVREMVMLQSKERVLEARWRDAQTRQRRIRDEVEFLPQRISSCERKLAAIEQAITGRVLLGDPGFTCVLKGRKLLSEREIGEALAAIADRADKLGTSEIVEIGTFGGMSLWCARFGRGFVLRDITLTVSSETGCRSSTYVVEGLVKAYRGLDAQRDSTRAFLEEMKRRLPAAQAQLHDLQSDARLEQEWESLQARIDELRLEVEIAK
ncbi:MAG: hypothetical protein ABL985_06565 [Casimicrobium sp.]